MKLWVVCRDVWTILATCEEERCALLEDLVALEEKHPADVAKIVRRFEHLAANGPPRNTQLCREIKDGIFELKAQRGLIRVFFFYDEGCFVICSHAVVKPKPKRLSTEIEKTKKVRAAYLRAKQDGTVQIEEDET